VYEQQELEILPEEKGPEMLELKSLKINQPEKASAAASVKINTAGFQEEEAKDFFAEFDQERNYVEVDFDGKIPEKPEEVRYTIVADFAVPYRCCDCMEKEEIREPNVSIKLPGNE